MVESEKKNLLIGANKQPVYAKAGDKLLIGVAQKLGREVVIVPPTPWERVVSFLGQLTSKTPSTPSGLPSLGKGLQYPHARASRGGND